MPVPAVSPPPLIDVLARRVPRVPVTRWLVLANLAVFAALLANGAGLWHAPNGVQLAWGANFGPATQDGQWWRLGSALFLHFGVLHLGMNLWALWDGGQLVERMYGHARFATIYFVAGIAGNLLSLVLQGNQAVSGGASGAIFGIYAALLVFLWRERHQLHPGEFRWLFWGAAGFSIATIVFGLSIPGIDNAAHIGGFVAGGLAGTLLARPLDPAIPVSRLPRWLAGGALLAAAAILVAQLPAPSYRWSEELAARREIGEFMREEAVIGRAWQDIVAAGRQPGASFEDIAGRIESDIAGRYEESFDELSRLHLDPAAPSASQLDRLRRYAGTRRDASRALAEELRARSRAVKPPDGD